MSNIFYKYIINLWKTKSRRIVLYVNLSKKTSILRLFIVFYAFGNTRHHGV